MVAKKRPDSPLEAARRRLFQVGQDLPKVLLAIEQPTEPDRGRDLHHLVPQVNEAMSAVEQADKVVGGPYDAPVPDSLRRALNLSNRAINAVANARHDDDASARIRSMGNGLEYYT
ncbi:hypothetical protein [Kribbella sp. VKM Ac-2569]|uniref:hypothetical protein n=1 Tax=Kribbella sp. VKM Ac-2569 TaxID=2512220 RepID=UPI00102D1977|nr:hypothetical protein [Kribbella sp. VKM Ac-2569]